MTMCYIKTLKTIKGNCIVFLDNYVLSMPNKSFLTDHLQTSSLTSYWYYCKLHVTFEGKHVNVIHFFVRIFKNTEEYCMCHYGEDTKAHIK